jgi:hypothetical protein
MLISMTPNASICSSPRLFARFERFFIRARAPQPALFAGARAPQPALFAGARAPQPALCVGGAYAFFAAAAVVLGCGGAAGTPAPARVPPPAPAAAPEQHRPTATATAEIGGLDEREAEASFRASLDSLQECVQNGVERLEFMGGSIEFAVKVGADRQAASVWAAQSSLGERLTEKCMFAALRSVTWPAPQGGLFGIARNSFEFEPKRGSPTPAVWDAGRVAGVVDHVHGSISECGSGSLESILITLYIGEEGQAIAGGAASDEPIDEAQVDCVVDAFLSAQYPRPERAPTKVRFRL